uniref:Peptidase S8/S53 domain-containing protein n=1 Tax=Populus trichocarpa TaxID=3694 RepID=B9H515_POPTR
MAAPEANRSAAWQANDKELTLKGTEPPLFNVISGTSMSCPHVSAMVAVVKSHYLSWNPSAIKPAILTTGEISTSGPLQPTVYDYGAGEISTSGPLQPAGLVYETTTIDCLNFLCHHGNNTSTIKVIFKDVPAGFACPKDLSVDLMSTINYPSIAVLNLARNQARTINRTLTNVAGDGAATYSLTIEAPNGIKIAVVPTSLQFRRSNNFWSV